MNKREAIAHLEELKNDFKEYVSIETQEKDVQALEVAIAALKETVKDIEDLKDVCMTVVNYLKVNFDTYCTVVITDSQIRLVRDEIGIQLEIGD